MNRWLKISLLSICLVTVGYVSNSQSAEEKEYTPKVVSKTLFDGALDGLTGKRTVIKEFTLPVGFKGGKHYHPAHVFVYVVEGEFSVDVEGKSRQTFKAGEIYQEEIGKVMSGVNSRTSGPTKVVVFQIGDADKPMMIKAGKK